LYCGRDTRRSAAGLPSASVGLPQLEHCSCVERTGQRHFGQTPTMGLRACRSARQCAHRAWALELIVPQAGHAIVVGRLTSLDFCLPQAFPRRAPLRLPHAESSHLAGSHSGSRFLTLQDARRAYFSEARQRRTKAERAIVRQTVWLTAARRARRGNCANLACSRRPTCSANLKSSIAAPLARLQGRSQAHRGSVSR